MITLNEENILHWKDDLSFYCFGDKIPIAFDTHALNKTETNITPISTFWLLNRRVNRMGVMLNMIKLAAMQGILLDSIREVLTETRDPETKIKFTVHLYREIEHPIYPGIVGVLYYDLILIVTPPFVGRERITKRLKPEQWIQKASLMKPSLERLNDLKPKDAIYYPFVITQAFTGGFKPKYSINKMDIYKGSPYRKRGGIVTFNALEHYGNTMSIEEREFLQLVNYQRNALDTLGNTLDAWRGVFDKYGKPLISNIEKLENTEENNLI